MNAVRLVTFGIFALWALPLSAVLPPDAGFRQKEIVQQRMRARAEYEQQQKDYELAIVAASARMQAAMENPPWMRTGGNETQRAVKAQSLLEADRSSQINHRFLVSVMLLILIGVAVGVVWYRTRELDG